ncbi:alpha/beta hydrolase [Gordonia sp. X0973]|uniref:poly(ethylene terephthalate) hydrolase family protein n=1 Tax=Gordonia sp. X0973 TaxID=2742602 RepID=UPI00265755C7|nr:alpha/beta hydrolase [Gordonia sp. X0973]
MFGNKKAPAPPPPDELMTDLARRGPHKVLRGDLGFVGVPGALFTPQPSSDQPASGLPLVVFGHSWLSDSGRYRDLMVHLASHGFVAAVPDVERGPAPSDVALAAGLRTALANLPRVRLGLSESVTVDGERTVLAGHGFGASAAVLALGPDVLAGTETVDAQGLAAVFPAPSTTTAFAAASSVRTPAMVIAAGQALDTVDANPLPLAQALAGPVTLHTLPGTSERALLQRHTLKSLIGVNGAAKDTHAAVRAMLTGFLQATVGDDPQRYETFLDPESTLGAALPVDRAEPDDDDRSHLEKLVSGPPKPPSKTSALSPIRALSGR